jgi:asparagine synthase (glutamine-hydrolysing)
MCGICGVIAREPLGDADDARVARITRALTHRGPDGEGTHRAPRVAFGMRRLSIIDLAGGWQPLHNEEGTIALVLNGEIYNYRELQQELRARGHKLRTGSDAEVLVHLYEERGADALHSLRGTFAFALHDTRAGRPPRVVLGRDRLGEKPLHLYEEPGRLTFASELGALVAGGTPFRLDAASVHSYLHFGYAPEPATMIAGVRQLDAGCVLEIELDPWRVAERRYWSLLDAPPIDDDPARRVREELERVAELVIRSDVPVGVALSGGIDSGAVAALAARASRAPLVAFSVGYAGRPPHDERAQAAALARQIGVPVHEVELSTAAMVDAFPATVRESDQPIADIAGYGHREVMRAARAHDTPVLLTGYGGDELFWGYDWVRDAVAESRQKMALAARGFPLSEYVALKAPAGVRRHQLRSWAREWGGLRASIERRRRQRNAPPDHLVFYELTGEWQGAARHALDVYSPAFRRTLDEANADPAALFAAERPWVRPDLLIMEKMFATYLRSVGLAQGDRLAMAHSVEARVPLVDFRLVETVVGLRKVRADDGEEPKAWFKRALKGVLPEEVLARPKRGFEPPVYEWHRALMERYGDRIRDGALVRHGVLSRDGAAALAGQALPIGGWNAMPFSVLVLELWCRGMEARAS